MQRVIKRLDELSHGHKATPEEFEAHYRKTSQQSAMGQQVNVVHADSMVLAVPQWYRGKIFADYHVANDGQAKAKKLAEVYVETFQDRLKARTSLIFTGNSGNGTTLLSLIMHQALVKAGYTVRYEPSLNFLRTLLEIKFKSNANFNSHFSALTKVQFLVLDEMTESVSASGKPTEIERKLLFDIINERYANSLCTLAITKRDRAGMIECLGMTTVDRLEDSGITIVFDWPSYRNK